MPKYKVRAIYKSHRDILVEADSAYEALNLNGEFLDEDEVDFTLYDTVSVEEVDVDGD